MGLAGCNRQTWASVLSSPWTVACVNGGGIPDSYANPLHFPGQIPTRLQNWRKHNHPFSLSFLEAVINYLGLGEVHKAIVLFVEKVAGYANSGLLQR